MEDLLPSPHLPRYMERQKMREGEFTQPRVLPDRPNFIISRPLTLCWFPCAASASSISPARSVSPRTRKATARLYVKSALEAISSEAVEEDPAADAAAA